MEEMRVLRKYFSFLNLSSRDVADTASLLNFVGYLVCSASEDGWNTARKAWSCYYWWRIQPIEMDHAVWPSVGMEN